MGLAHKSAVALFCRSLERAEFAQGDVGDGVGQHRKVGGDLLEARGALAAALVHVYRAVQFDLDGVQPARRVAVMLGDEATGIGFVAAERIAHAAEAAFDHVGEEPGAGQGAKLLGNLLWFGQVVAVTEALLLGQAMGIPASTLRRTLAAGPAGSAFIDEYLDRLLAGDDLTDFSLARCVEELDILAEQAQAADVPFTLSNQVVTLHREALERFGSIDGELLAARLLEERAGRRLGGVN